MNDFFSKIKQILLTSLLKMVKFLIWLKTPIWQTVKIFFKPIIWPFIFIIRFLLVPFYRLLRNAKRKLLDSLAKLNGQWLEWCWQHASILMLALIGIIVAFSGLKAQEVKPDSYGNKSPLYQLVQASDLFSLTIDKNQPLEEVTEGPINEQKAPSSYLHDQAISADEPAGEVNQGINTLISTTGGDSALISPEITDLDLVVKSRDRIIEYQVQPGDSLSTIASKFNLKTTTVMWENNLTYYSVIKPGQTLKILPVDGLSHKARAKDTVAALAKKYKISAEEIIEFNKLASASDLQAGQIVILPGAAQLIAAAPARDYSLKNIFSPSPQSGTRLQWPSNAYRITQYYSWRHHGLDIGNKTGQPIYAAESGVVQRSGWNVGGYGYMIMINHGNGIITLYGHASKLYVKVGDKVKRGQVIAAIGSTGRSTGPHLHFEVRVGGSLLNPLGYIR